MRLWRENIGRDPAAVEAGSHSNLNKKACGPWVVGQFGQRSGEFYLARGGIKPPLRAGGSSAQRISVTSVFKPWRHGDRETFVGLRSAPALSGSASCLLMRKPENTRGEY